MRTTIRMNEGLARRAKQHATRTNRSFTQLVEQAVAGLLSQEQKPKPSKRIVLPVSGDPRKRITHAQYQRIIEQMYDEEAEHILKGGGA